jgi:diaminopimelate epimerase
MGVYLMELVFTKMHGLGNDFILIDCIKQPETENLPFRDLSKNLCHRRFGIGADQILLLSPSDNADFMMKIFNADGQEVEMCGNGIRCLAKYIWDRGLSDKNILKIDTLAGIIRPERVGKLVKVDMGMPIFEPEKIPVKIGQQANIEEKAIVDYPIKIKDREFKITCVSMGNPHAVVFLNEDISDFPVSLYGPEIESHQLFPKRTNVEFVNVKSKTELTMRVWERGSGETMACGTGASAAGVAAMLKDLTARNVIIHLPGGDLIIEWTETNRVYMTGPATEVFEGRIKVLTEQKVERRRHPRRFCNVPMKFHKKGEVNGTLHKCIAEYKRIRYRHHCRF